MEPEPETVFKHRLEHLIIAFLRDNTLFGYRFDFVVAPASSDRGPARSASYVIKSSG